MTTNQDALRMALEEIKDLLLLAKIQGSRKDCNGLIERAELIANDALSAPLPKDVQDGESEWRRLALQFDGHRMQAIGHLKALLDDPTGHSSKVSEFLAAAPLSGEEVLAQRIAALSPSVRPVSQEGHDDPMDLQPEPHPPHRCCECEGCKAYWQPATTSRSQEDVRKEALEEAAKVCEVIGKDWRDHESLLKFSAAEYIAAAIRSLQAQGENV